MTKYNFYKKFLFIVLFFAFINHLNAQTGLNFQGVARNINNTIIASQDITLKLSILQGTSTGIAEYIEVRKVTTNAQGLFTAVIGDSLTMSTLGKFSDIDWKLSPKFLKIELDPAEVTILLRWEPRSFSMLLMQNLLIVCSQKIYQALFQLPREEQVLIA
jgi:hypothetical protein